MNLGDFYSENTHTNSVTGCRIWDGDIVKMVPVVKVPGSTISVRKAVFESVKGTQPYRTKYETSCENPYCVKLEHIVALAPEQVDHDFPWDKVEEAAKLHSEGFRNDIIAQRLEVTPPTISKWLKVWKVRQTEVSAE